MLLSDNHHYVSTEGKSIEEIVDLRFKEYEIRKRKEAEDRAALEAKLKENKTEMTSPKKEEPKKVELATVSHTTAFGRAVTKLRHALHL